MIMTRQKLSTNKYRKNVVNVYLFVRTSMCVCVYKLRNQTKGHYNIEGNEIKIFLTGYNLDEEKKTYFCLRGKNVHT